MEQCSKHPFLDELSQLPTPRKHQLPAHSDRAPTNLTGCWSDGNALKAVDLSQKGCIEIRIIFKCQNRADLFLCKW